MHEIVITQKITVTKKNNKKTKKGYKIMIDITIKIFLMMKEKRENNMKKLLKVFQKMRSKH